jgi:DNA-cytosine methyltransferase
MKKGNYVTHFCGLGGACWGLEQAGLQCNLAIDSNGDGPCIETRAKNLKCDNGLCLDIRKYFDKDASGDYVYAKNEHRQDVFMLWTSPPCKKFSVANKASELDREMENLYAASVDFAKWARPKFFVLENVVGLIKHEARDSAAGKVGKLTEMKKAFRGLGYSLDLEVYDSFFFGVPQHRRRVFMIGSLNHETGLLPAYPKNAAKTYFSDIRQRNNTSLALNGCSYVTMMQKLAKIIKKRGYFKIRVVGGKKELRTPMDALPTVTCGFDGGITRKKCAILDETTDGVAFLRHPSIEEGLQAQGFPLDWMRNLPANRSAAWRMVGNAVPSPVSKAIAEHLLRLDAGEKPPSRMSRWTDDGIMSFAKKVVRDTPVPQWEF